MTDKPIAAPPLAGQLLDALEHLADPLLASDADGRLCYANGAAAGLLRVSPSTLPLPLGEALADAALAHRLEQVIAAPADEDAFVWDTEDSAWEVHTRQAGDWRLLWCTRQLPEGGLRERLETEHMRRFWAVALAGVGSWTWDIKEDRLRADAVLAQLTGIDDGVIPAEQLFRHIHPDDRPALRAAIDQALQSGDSEVELDSEFRFRPDDGDEIWLAMRGGVVRDLDGSPLMMSGVHFDITERKHAEQALRDARDALQEASRAKDSFLAKVSHEIRTPLTAILGYAELMARQPRGEQDRHHLDEIRDSSRYLQSLVDDLLDLSRIIAGKIAIEPRPLDLHHLGHELLSTMNMRAAEKQLGFSLEVGAGVPQQTRSDPVRVRQILTNLVGNAVKFTERGEVSVRIRPRLVDGQSFVAFEVRDTGPGIAPERLRDVFEPFAQTRLSDASRHGGLGLGLAISRRLARMLGGHIEVDSSPGHGSTFTFLLPLVEVAAPDQATDQPAHPPAPSGPLQARLLAVDDVPAILALLATHLREAGAEVVTAADGRQALAAVAEAEAAGRPFDLILMDLHMPHLDGPATLAQLREQGCRVPVIALSASAMKNDREQCLSLGFADFVAKPFSAEQLRGHVAQVLDSRGAPDAASAPAGRPLLVVEDHEALAELTAKQLASLGFRVETAHNGAAALDRAAALAPVAAVIDLTLPDMDGVALCRALRDDPALAGCRFIAYTGEQEAQVHEQARAAGFDAVLLKPAALGDFAAQLEPLAQHA